MQNEKSKTDRRIIDFLSGTLSDGDCPVLLHQLQSDEDFRMQLQGAAKVRALSFIPVLEKEKQSSYEQLMKTVQKPIFLPKENFLKYYMRMAAMLILAVTTGIGSFFLYSKYNSLQNQSLISQTIVPLGSHAKVVLPDGSVVLLNSGAEFRYDRSFGAKDRRVSLKGEGYFEVAKDASRPFVVSTDRLEIKVLGTVFNVKAFTEESTIKIDLIEGKVKVTSLNDRHPETKTMNPNEMIVYDKKTGLLTLSKTDAAKAAQWTKGKLTFVNESMEKIIRDLERTFNVHFIIETQRIKSENFSGSINLDQPLNEILENIDVDHKFDRSYEGQNVFIRDRFKH